MPDVRQGTEGQQIVKIRLPEAQTQPPEADGNWRSWGRSSTRTQASKAAGRDLEREAG